MKIKDSKGFNPLHTAIVASHPISCEVLIQNGADCLEVWKKKSRPLHLACQVGNVQIISLLLSTLTQHYPTFVLNE